MDLYRFNKALQLAAIKTLGMIYPYEKGQPHISHHYFVAGVLQAHGFDEDVVIAGILHDLVEDTDVTVEDIRKQFGERVARIVEAVSFDQSLPWKERSKTMAERIAKASPDAKAVKTADITHHLELCVEEFKGLSKGTYMADHGVDEALWKYNLLLKAIRTGWQHPILDTAMGLLKECEKLKGKGNEGDKSHYFTA